MWMSSNNGCRKFRVTENVFRNPDTESYHTVLYTVRLQVRILGVWVTVWAETCDYSDGDTRTCITKRAEEVRKALTESV